LPRADAPVIFHAPPDGGRMIMFGRDTELVSQRQALKILLIEHDEAFARSISGMLEQAKDTIGKVEIVPSLAEGLIRIKQENFGVILLEFFLPDGAGLANIAMLQESASLIPVIVLGAVDDEAIAVEAVHAGAQDYLVKSHINRNWLLRSIRHTIERHESDLALVRAEKKYHSIFDHLVEGIFQTTPNGSYLLANMALARIYGYNTPDELMSSVTDIGRRLYVAPGRREEFRRTMDEHDTITGFESQIFRKDGSIIWISENCRAIRDDKGRLLHYEGTVEDITARRDAQESVLQSEALYHSLVETMPQNVFRKDMQGRFTFANQQYCRHYGAPLEDILGKTDFDFFPRSLAEKYQADDCQVMATGKSLSVIEEHQPIGQEKSFVQVVKTPLHGSSGQIIGLQGMFWDVTEQKLAEERVRRAQESLRESEILYHSLVDTMPQCIFRKDLTGKYTFANREFCRFVGRNPEEVIGKTIHDFLPPELAAQRDTDDLRVITSGKAFTQIEESRFENRNVKYIQVLKIPIFDANGKATGLQGMFWDITDIKLAEQRITKAKDELAVSEGMLREKNLQMEGELKMAREIQVAMLPQQYPVLPKGATASDVAFQFIHRYLPSGTVGGDFFSITPISDTQVAVLICDVAGHGVRSALITAMIRAIVEELRPIAHEPGLFVTKLNAKLCAILKPAGTSLLTTAFYLVGDSITGKVLFANAGHPKPLLISRSSNTVEPVMNPKKTSQPALGLMEKSQYETGELQLAPRDMMLLFTDGVYEVQSKNGQLYSKEMLQAVVAKHIKKSCKSLFDLLFKEVQDFAANNEFDDDVCMVGMEFTGSNTTK
jgi:sigma-B regulation protein RsbU (phosphoserine phosphatase)